MMIRTVLLAFAAVAFLSAAPVSAEEAEPIDLSWADLLPEGEMANIQRLQQMQAAMGGVDHFGAETMPQIMTFNAVEALDGQRVRLPGYVLPFDFTASGDVSRFLLVPYVGACIHVPPPPPNQLVYVESETPVSVDGLWDPVFVEGVIRIERQDSDLASAAYTLELIEVTPYRS
jgi:hypothetical protein